MLQTCTNSLVQDSDAELRCEKCCHLTKFWKNDNKKSCQIVAQTKTDQVRQKKTRLNTAISSLIHLYLEHDMTIEFVQLKYIHALFS